MRVHDQPGVDHWVADARARVRDLGPDELSRTLFEFTHEFRVPHRRAADLSDELRSLGYETTRRRSLHATTVFAATRGVLDWQRLERSAHLFESLIEIAQRHGASYGGWRSHRITTFGA